MIDTRRSSFESNPLIREIRELLRRGLVTEADARLRNAPESAERWYLCGIVANRKRDHHQAVVALRRAIELRPDAPLSWLALGTSLARSNAWREAADAYRAAIARDPGMADAHLNLGIALKQLGKPLSAMRSLYTAWSSDPMLFDAAKQCVATIAEHVRTCDSPAMKMSLPASSRTHSFTIVICSIDDRKCARVVALYRRLFAEVPHELVVIRDARSLASAYNAATDDARGEFVLLTHDDIEILEDDFAARIAWLLSNEFDVVGVIGSTRLDGPAIGWSGHPNLRGWITHHAGKESRWEVDLLDPQPISRGVVALDGVLIGARRDVLRALPFDATTFDGFHLYDLDWSYRVSQAGFRMGVAGDLLVVHQSRGTYGDAWEGYARRFCAKHDVGHERPRMSSFFGATLSSAAHVRAFFDLLRALAASARGSSDRCGRCPIHG